VRTKAKKHIDRIILLAENKLGIRPELNNAEYARKLGNKICDYHIELFKRRKIKNAK